MAGLEDLYREIILDHYRSPRNRGELPVPPAHKVEGFNPLCGDEVVLYLELDPDAGTVRDVKISGQGCSISQASTSMMSAAVKLGDLEALQGVVKFPVRIKCATLAWNTLQQALDETAQQA